MKADAFEQEVNVRLVQVLLVIVRVLLSICLLLGVKLKEAGSVGVPYLYAIDSSGVIVDRGVPGTRPLRMVKRMMRKVRKGNG